MTDEAMSPLRQRMIEDMTIRKFAPKTQHDYVQRVKHFAAFLGRSPDTASFGGKWLGRSDPQPKRLDTAVLFQNHAWARRHRQPYPVYPRATQAAGRPEPGRSRTFSRCGAGA